MSEESDKKKRGRPTKEVARCIQFKILMTKDEYENLANASKLVGKSKSKIARDGIMASINNEIYMHKLKNESNVYEDFDEFEEEIDDL